MSAWWLVLALVPGGLVVVAAVLAVAVAHGMRQQGFARPPVWSLWGKRGKGGNRHG